MSHNGTAVLSRCPATAAILVESGLFSRSVIWTVTWCVTLLLITPLFAFAAPDLTGTITKFKHKVKKSGSKLSIKVRVCNVGEDPTTDSFALSLLLSADSVLSDDDMPLRSVINTKRLNPGECRTKKLKRKDIQGSTAGKFAFIVIDSAEEIPEGDETNNTLNRQIPLIGGADSNTQTPGQWWSNGPEGGGIGALAIDPRTPSTVYAGTSSAWFPAGPGVLKGNLGVFKSLDGGETWSASNAGLTNLDVQALAIDPGTPSTVYAGTTAGVFKSLDGGGTWTVRNGTAGNFSLPEFPVIIVALAIDPERPNTVYAGDRSGVFKSVTGGGTWTAINTGLTTTAVESLAIAPTIPTTVYAGTAGGGVFQMQTP